MRRRSGKWRTRRSGRAYSGTVVLMIGTLGIGALILFLLRQDREAVREKVDRVSEAVKSRAKGFVETSKEDAEPQEAVDHSADREEGSAEAAGAERKRVVREFGRRLEEHSADQEEQDVSEETKTKETTREELRRIVRESVRRSEQSASDREQNSAEGTGGETRRTSERESASDEQVTVVGILAKMGEGFQETGGGQFILSSEDEGNFDLHGKEDELDNVYQQQIEARVVGRISDEDSQPRKLEVDEVEPA